MRAWVPAKLQCQHACGLGAPPRPQANGRMSTPPPPSIAAFPWDLAEVAAREAKALSQCLRRDAQSRSEVVCRQDEVFVRVVPLRRHGCAVRHATGAMDGSAVQAQGDVGWNLRVRRPGAVHEGRGGVRPLSSARETTCQWSSNNPQLWSSNFPHPSTPRSKRWKWKFDPIRV